MKTFVNIYKWLVVSIFAVFSVAISSNAQQGCTASPTGLVSWWRAEGNGLDSVGGNTAFAPLISGDVTFGPGKVGQAFQLNSPDANLVVPASSTLNVAAGGSFTAEAWINLSNVDGYHPIIEWHDNGRNPGAHLWIIPSGALYSDIKDTNGNAHPFNSANNVVAANVFQHVALTYDHSTGTGTIYLNGAVVAQANLGSFVPQTSFNLWFGHRPGDVPGDITYGSYLGGRLDEVSIYNRALGSNEIAAIYSAGAAGKCDGVSSGVAPSITHQPTNQTVAAGANVSFSATATGSPTLHYQWYGPSETLIPGANSSTLTLSNVQPAAAGDYFLLVTNQFGFAVSSNAVLTVTGGGTGGGSNSCTPPPSGLVAWWKGENNTLDSVGANNGIVIDGPIAYAPGEVGSAFHYDDAGGYVSVPAAPSLDVGQGGGLTLEAWIQPADLQNQMPLFEWQFNTNTDANGIHFWISAINGPGCLFANIVDSNFNSHWIYSAPGLVTGDYQHVALTYDKSSGVASIYRNGVLVVSQNLGSFTPNTTGNLLLGERTYLNNDPQFHYVGGLDEMSVYSRALSQSEIAAIFNAGSAGKCGGSNGPAAAGLIVPNYSVSNQVYNPAGTMNQPLRMQMVYGASQFPSHPIVITELRWRPDVNAGGPLSVIVSNLQVKLSTTAAGPDQLSTIFTQNTGSDETVVYSGAAAISTAFTTLSNGTKAFDISLHLQTPFTYDPSKGNLLVDLRDLYGCIPARTVQFNIVNSTGVYGDAVSRVFSIDPNATNAETADTGADVLDIVYTAATNSGTAPVITQQPTNRTVNAGGIATFSVTATGSPTLHYQWYGPAGALISGATASTLTLSNVQPASAGAYFVFVTNSFGFAQSSNAVLTVTGGDGGGGTNSCTPAPSGIVSWWPGEGNGNDIVGSNNAVLESGVTFAPGKVGQAFQLLNYSNGWAHVPASASLNVGSGNGFTMEGWINVASVSGLHPIAEWHGNTRTSTGVTLWLNSSQSQSGSLFASIIETNETEHSLASPTGAVQPNVFQHVALTYDKSSGSATLYLNGAAVAYSSIGSIVPQTISDLYFGHRPLDVSGDASYGAILGGSLDEFAIYNRALGSNEIAAIYNAGANGKCSPTNSNTGTAPVITSAPTNVTVAVGANVTFAVTATGTPTLHYQWYGPAGALISGATTSTLTLSNVQPASAGAYYVFVTNSFGFAQSSNAVLTVIGEAPVITRQPTNQTVPVGGTATFSVIVSVPPTVVPHFQWYGPNGAPIPGAATSTLFMFNVQPSAAGAYFVIVTNQFGSVTSSNAVLTVTNPAVSSCVPAPTNAAAWWPAEGTGVDIVGGATATLNGGATFAPGEVGQAFLLNGTNDYLTATSSNLNIAANGSFTVEAWIKVSDVADYHPIVEWNDNAGHAGVHFWILPYSGETPGVLFANLVDTNGHSHSFHTPGGSVSTNGFQHVALTYDQPSGIATIYVNSNIVAQLPLGSFAPQTSFPLWMGHRPNDVPGDATYGAHLGGLLDELTLYRRALSQSEIGAIYNAGANGKCPPSVIVHAAINPQPTVTLSASGGSYTLSWPVSAANYTLQSTADLTPPINWTNVPGTLQTNGGLIQITLPEGGPQGYFRLYQP